MEENTPTPDEPQEKESVPEEKDPKPSHPSKSRKFSSDKPTMSEIIRLKKPNTRSCHILLDSSLAHEVQELEREISRLENKARFSKSSLADTTPQKLDRLKEELERKMEEAENYVVEFRFQDVGRKRYDELVRENPPTDEEKKEYKEMGGEGALTYSLSSFPPKLVSLTNVEPGITEEEAFAIFDDWSEGDLETLFTTALLVCKEPTSLPKSRAGIAQMDDSEQSLTTQPSEESPTQSS